MRRSWDVQGAVLNELDASADFLDRAHAVEKVCDAAARPAVHRPHDDYLDVAAPERFKDGLLVGVELAALPRALAVYTVDLLRLDEVPLLFAVVLTVGELIVFRLVPVRDPDPDAS